MEHVTDPDRPIDLLIGSYGHAHVAGARTYYERVDNRTEATPRTVTIDEFPGDAFGRSFGKEALDHAVWLAETLTGDIDSRGQLLASDLWDDGWVRAWLRGEGDDHPASEQAAAHLTAADAWLDVHEAVERARDSPTEIDDELLDRMAAADPRTDMDTIRETHTAIREAWSGLFEIPDPAARASSHGPRRTTTCRSTTISGDSNTRRSQLVRRRLHRFLTGSPSRSHAHQVSSGIFATVSHTD